MPILNRRFLSWNKYTKELTLYKPLSLFAVYGFYVLVGVAAIGLISQLF